MFLETRAHVPASLTYIVLLTIRAFYVVHYPTLALYWCSVLRPDKLVTESVDRFVIRLNIVVFEYSAEVL